MSRFGSRSRRSELTPRSVLRVTDTATKRRQNVPFSESMIKNRPVNLVYVDDYELTMRAARMANRTITERLRIIRMFARESGVQPAHATTRDILEWLGTRDHLSDWTLASYYVNLRQFYKWMVLMEARADDPMLKIKAPRIPNTEPRPVSNVGLQRLLHTRMHRRTFVMILLASLQGMRVLRDRSDSR